jgi:predicted nuclease of predicted toxin-antitoxin system
MRFLIDNALSPQVANLLSVVGHDAVHLRAYGLQAASDDVVLDRAEKEDRILISADTDFGRILALRNTSKPSVILFRWPDLRLPEDQVNILLKNIPNIIEDLDRGSMVVIEETRLRVRQLPIDSK